MKRIGSAFAIKATSELRTTLAETLHKVIIEKAKQMNFCDMSVATELTPGLLQRLHKGDTEIGLDSLVAAFYSLQHLKWL